MAKELSRRTSIVGLTDNPSAFLWMLLRLNKIIPFIVANRLLSICPLGMAID